MGGKMGDATADDIKKFERELEGCVKGSKIAAKKLKEIWGVHHNHG